MYLHLFKAAHIGEDMLSALSREDIRDLFPGPEHFLRRIWLLTHKEEQVINFKYVICIFFNSWHNFSTDN